MQYGCAICGHTWDRHSFVGRKGYYPAASITCLFPGCPCRIELATKPIPTVPGPLVAVVGAVANTFLPPETRP